MIWRTPVNLEAIPVADPEVRLWDLVCRNILSHTECWIGNATELQQELIAAGVSREELLDIARNPTWIGKRLADAAARETPGAILCGRVKESRLWMLRDLRGKNSSPSDVVAEPIEVHVCAV